MYSESEHNINTTTCDKRHFSTRWCDTLALNYQRELKRRLNKSQRILSLSRTKLHLHRPLIRCPEYNTPARKSSKKWSTNLYSGDNEEKETEADESGSLASFNSLESSVKESSDYPDPGNLKEKREESNRGGNFHANVPVKKGKHVGKWHQFLGSSQDIQKLDGLNTFLPVVSSVKKIEKKGAEVGDNKNTSTLPSSLESSRDHGNDVKKILPLDGSCFGVSYTSSDGGEGFWVCYWSRNGQKLWKQFSTKKHGFEVAQQLATSLLKSKVYEASKLVGRLGKQSLNEGASFQHTGSSAYNFDDPVSVPTQNQVSSAEWTSSEVDHHTESYLKFSSSGFSRVGKDGAEDVDESKAVRFINELEPDLCHEKKAENCSYKRASYNGVRSGQKTSFKSYSRQHLRNCNNKEELSIHGDPQCSPAVSSFRCKASRFFSPFEYSVKSHGNVAHVMTSQPSRVSSVELRAPIDCVKEEVLQKAIPRIHIQKQEDSTPEEDFFVNNAQKFLGKKEHEDQTLQDFPSYYSVESLDLKKASKAGLDEMGYEADSGQSESNDKFEENSVYAEEKTSMLRQLPDEACREDFWNGYGRLHSRVYMKDGDNLVGADYSGMTRSSEVSFDEKNNAWWVHWKNPQKDSADSISFNVDLYGFETARKLAYQQHIFNVETNGKGSPASSKRALDASDYTEDLPQDEAPDEAGDRLMELQSEPQSHGRNFKSQHGGHSNITEHEAHSKFYQRNAPSSTNFSQARASNFSRNDIIVSNVLGGFRSPFEPASSQVHSEAYMKEGCNAAVMASNRTSSILKGGVPPTQLQHGGNKDVATASVRRHAGGSDFFDNFPATAAAINTSSAGGGGVYLDTTSYTITQFGSGKWVACWEINGRLLQRSFLISRFGYSQAKVMAEAWRSRKYAHMVNAVSSFSGASISGVMPTPAVNNQAIKSRGRGRPPKADRNALKQPWSKQFTFQNLASSKFLPATSGDGSGLKIEKPGRGGKTVYDRYGNKLARREMLLKKMKKQKMAGGYVMTWLGEDRGKPDEKWKAFGAADEHSMTEKGTKKRKKHGTGGFNASSYAPSCEGSPARQSDAPTIPAGLYWDPEEAAWCVTMPPQSWQLSPLDPTSSSPTTDGDATVPNLKVFHSSVYGYDQAKRLALLHQKKLEKQLLHYYYNSGSPGIAYERSRHCWRVTFWIPSKQMRRNKYFNISKYGWERAKQLALLYRHRVDELNGEEPLDWGSGPNLPQQPEDQFLRQVLEADHPYTVKYKASSGLAGRQLRSDNCPGVHDRAKLMKPVAKTRKKRLEKTKDALGSRGSQIKSWHVRLPKRKVLPQKHYGMEEEDEEEEEISPYIVDHQEMPEGEEFHSETNEKEVPSCSSSRRDSQSNATVTATDGSENAYHVLPDYCVDKQAPVEAPRIWRRTSDPNHPTSNVKGVHYSKRENAWICRWSDAELNKVVVKSFQVKLHGFDEAKRLAEKQRLEKEATGQAKTRAPSEASTSMIRYSKPHDSFHGAWKVFWTHDNHSYVKSFDVNASGAIKARQLACNFKRKIDMLVRQADYPRRLPLSLKKTAELQSNMEPDHSELNDEMMLEDELDGYEDEGMPQSNSEISSKTAGGFSAEENQLSSRLANLERFKSFVNSFPEKYADVRNTLSRTSPRRSLKHSGPVMDEGVGNSGLDASRNFYPNKFYNMETCENEESQSDEEFSQSPHSANAGVTSSVRLCMKTDKPRAHDLETSKGSKREVKMAANYHGNIKYPLRELDSVHAQAPQNSGESLQVENLRGEDIGDDMRGPIPVNSSRVEPHRVNTDIYDESADESDVDASSHHLLSASPDHSDAMSDDENADHSDKERSCSLEPVNRYYMKSDIGHQSRYEHHVQEGIGISVASYNGLSPNEGILEIP